MRASSLAWQPTSFSHPGLLCGIVEFLPFGRQPAVCALLMEPPRSHAR